MSKKIIRFDADEWGKSINSSLSTYCFFFNLIHHGVDFSMAIDGHIMKGGFKWVEGKAKPLFLPDSLKGDPKFVELCRKSSEISYKMNEAFDIYSRQMVVIGATFVENILEDFFQVMFIERPERMFDFLKLPNEREVKGYVKLEKILAAKSKPALIKNLADEASDAMTRGKFSSWIKRLERTTKYKIPKKIVSELGNMVEKRHRIVHGGLDEEISHDKVHEIFDSILSLITCLCKICKKDNLPCNSVPISG